MPAARRLPAPARLVLRVAPRGRASRGDGLTPDERFVAVERPYDFDESLRFLPFGPYDPTCRRGPGLLWKAGHTPAGPVTLELARTAEGVRGRAWGGGSAWALERLPQLLGLADQPAAFKPADPRLAPLARRFRAVHLPRSPWVLDGLVHYILQQRVSFRDAMRAQRRLVRAKGAPAPGPPGLLLPLEPAEWKGLDAHAAFRAGIDAQRARALRSAGSETRRVQSAFDRPNEAARRALATVPGCGPWTVEITMGFVLGDPDAVPTGDLHLPHEVCWALAGEARGSDRRMLELLLPWQGQRFRVLRLLLASGRLHMAGGAAR